MSGFQAGQKIEKKFGFIVQKGEDYRKLRKELSKAQHPDKEIITDKGTKIVLKYNEKGYKGYSAWEVDKQGNLIDMRKGSPRMNDDLITYLRKNF